MPCDVVLRDRSLITGDRVLTAHREFPATPAAAHQARTLVAAVLGADPVPPPADVTWTAHLLTSELVTNAVLHACTQLHVGVALGDNGLLIAIADGDPRPPSERKRRPTPDYEETGRGMTLVAALADDFGWRPRSDSSGKIMWALLSLNSG